MKKMTILLTIPVYLLMVVGFSCNDIAASTGEPGKAMFWKKTETAETHYLYIDGANKGIVPFLPASPTAGNDNEQLQGTSAIQTKYCCKDLTRVSPVLLPALIIKNQSYCWVS